MEYSENIPHAPILLKRISFLPVFVERHDRTDRWHSLA